MRYNPTERIGVNAIERIVLQDLKWIFREQPLVDVGIDAIIEIVNNGEPTCQFIATQIKSGKGNFHENEKSWTYYASDIHYNYWLKSNLPVILIGYVPEDSIAYWEVIEAKKFVRTKRRWKIEIPKKKQFCSKSEKLLLQLVGNEEVNIQETFPTIDIAYLLSIKEDLKYITESKLYIEKLTIYLTEMKEESNAFTLRLNEFIQKGLKNDNPQVTRVFSSYALKILSTTSKMEKAINDFSQNFSSGSKALLLIFTYCKKFELLDTFYEAKMNLISYPDAVNNAINQISNLKLTVDNFSKSNKELKSATIVLSEVINLIIREFTVAKNTVESIIDTLEE